MDFAISNSCIVLFQFNLKSINYLIFNKYMYGWVFKFFFRT